MHGVAALKAGVRRELRHGVATSRPRAPPMWDSCGTDWLLRRYLRHGKDRTWRRSRYQGKPRRPAEVPHGNHGGGDMRLTIPKQRQLSPAPLFAAFPPALAVPSAAAGADMLRVGPGKVVRPSGMVASPPATGSTAARATPQERYDAAIAGRTSRPTVAPTVNAAFAPPGFQAQFAGEDIATCCARPPDTHGAVGQTQFTEVTNAEGVSVFRKTDGVKLKQTSFASFFGYSARSIFDPRVVYDKTWNRWVIHAEAFPESTTIQRAFIAVSTGPDAAGS